MGKSGEEFMSVRIKAEMNESIFKEIPAHLRDDIKIKYIDIPDCKEMYQKSKLWCLVNESFVKSLKAKLHLEDELRSNEKLVNNQLNK